MKNIMKIVLVAAASISTVALADHHENCQVGEQKVHVKNKKECTAQKGTWIKTAKKEEKKADAAAPAPAPAAGHDQQPADAAAPAHK